MSEAKWSYLEQGKHLRKGSRMNKERIVLIILAVLLFVVLVVIPLSRKTTLKGDINADGRVDALDLSIVLNDWSDKARRP